jgi:hypothetical protein
MFGICHARLYDFDILLCVEREKLGGTIMYSHRNGETEPPTVDGDYFRKYRDGGWDIVGIDCNLLPGRGIISYMGTDEFDYLDKLEDGEFQWYGPIVPHWIRND